MVFLWFSYGFPMVVLWFSYGFPMVFTENGTTLSHVKSQHHPPGIPMICPLLRPSSAARSVASPPLSRPWWRHRKTPGDRKRAQNTLLVVYKPIYPLYICIYYIYYIYYTDIHIIYIYIYIYYILIHVIFKLYIYIPKKQPIIIYTYIHNSYDLLKQIQSPISRARNLGFGRCDFSRQHGNREATDNYWW